jgi:hypothetical protein
MPISSGFIKKHLPRSVDAPPAVKTACVELSKLASVISMYYVLCGGGTPCKFAEALETLFLYAAQAGGAKEALKVMTGRVPLEALELENGQALALLKRRLGPRPHWLDAVAAALAYTYLQTQKRPKRLDERLLTLALCGWASKTYREDPQNPLWRVVEGVEPEKVYTFEELAEALRDVPQETLRRVWERAEIFHRDSRSYGHQLILAALHILMDPEGR